jgi:D-beta-D-heptose 7-phosphate kinase/D-beta-D-heptose 1-phosphate adenosyltransferase
VTVGKVAELVGSFAGVRVAVAGDLMLDEALEGEVDRVSPEAPVPVVAVRASEERLGGAGNVAHSCAALGARVRLAGVVGDDAAGDGFLAVCRHRGVDADAVGRVAGRPTTRKLRVFSQHQQVLRLDWEVRTPVELGVARPLVARLTAGEPPGALVLSDYQKGFLTPELLAELIAWARDRRVPVVVDPKSADFTRYRGATVVTPNLKELERATGRSLEGAGPEPLVTAARELLERSGAEAMCLTRGERGLLLVAPGDVEEIPAESREVYDVTGAGDTVVAVLALALAAGSGLARAARLANAAAGVVVGKPGTATVTPRELLAAVAPSPASKVLSWTELAERRSWWRLEEKRVVFTNGCFDLLHAGHLKLLREAATHGDVLVVGINTDDSVARLKGPGRPLIPETERAALLAALEMVDAVVTFGEDTPRELIETLRPEVLVKGADYREDQVVGRELVEELVLVELVPERSTTALIDRMDPGESPS